MVLLAAACVNPPGNTPETYDAVTEANHYKGCLSAFGVPESQIEAVIDLEKVEVEGEEVFQLTLNEDALDADYQSDFDSCGCVYEGIVDADTGIEFADYEAIDSALQDPPAPDSTATTVPAAQADSFDQLQEIWAGC